MPQPNAVMSVPTSADASILSKRAFSTLRIFPLSGRIACVRRSRPCLAEPPAESPSTKNISRGRDFFLLRGEFLFDVVVQGARQGSAVAREVRTAVLLRNIVRVAKHALLIRIVPLHGDFDLRVAVAGLEPQHGRMNRRLAA